MWFEDAAKNAKDVKKVANWILAELLAVLNEQKKTIADVTITPAHITELVNLIADKKISGAQGKTVFAKMLETNKMPSVIAKEEGMEVSMSVEERKRAELQENAIAMAKEHPEDVAMLIRTWLMEE